MNRYGITAWSGVAVLACMVVFAHWKAEEERRLPPVVVHHADGSCHTNPPPRMWTIIAEVSEAVVQGLADGLADADFSDD